MTGQTGLAAHHLQWSPDANGASGRFSNLNGSGKFFLERVNAV
jgi:hypothetical protein